MARDVLAILHVIKTACHKNVFRKHSITVVVIIPRFFSGQRFNQTRQRINRLGVAEAPRVWRRRRVLTCGCCVPCVGGAVLHVAEEVEGELIPKHHSPVRCTRYNCTVEWTVRRASNVPGV